MRRICRKVVLARTAANAVRPPECGFQINVRCIERDGRAVTAHDSGEAFDLLAVGDYADGFIEFDRVAIEQFKRLALLAPAHLNAAMDLVQVEHMRRTAEFEHHVIRNIDERGNTALPGALETLDYPCRRFGVRIYTANHATGKTSAQVRRRHFDRQDFVDTRRHRLDIERVQRRARDGGGFARDAKY